MDDFLNQWNEAALTSLGFFWMAFWAFALGYVVSSGIQVFVTRERMRRAMGEAGPRSIALATFFGFVSSSCSFAALAGAKAFYKKGAGLIPSLAFLLASTNLVIELGIIIAIFLSWQFVVGEYLGGLLLVLFMWGLVRLTLPRSVEQAAREHVGRDDGDGDDAGNWKQKVASLDGWAAVARQYFMEWGMVWQDVAFGFTVAGAIAAFVPAEFFATLFPGSGVEPTFPQTLAQTLVGPIAAFFTFIGSMGNIPLAAILYANGVSFAGVMAFIFSDLVVFPVLRIMGKYFGWRMAVYVMAVFLVALVASALVLHYGFTAADLLPKGVSGREQVNPSERFGIDYTFFLNLGFLAVTGVLWYLSRRKPMGDHSGGGADEPGLLDRLLTVAAYASFAWLAIGAGLGLFL